MNRNLCNYCGFLVSYPVLGRRPRGCPCRQAPYCDALCQSRDWRIHKSLCLWRCLMFKVQEVVEFPEDIVMHICKFLEPPSQRARKKRNGTLNLSVRDGRYGSESFNVGMRRKKHTLKSLHRHVVEAPEVAQSSGFGPQNIDP